MKVNNEAEHFGATLYETLYAYENLESFIYSDIYMMAKHQKSRHTNTANL